MDADGSSVRRTPGAYLVIGATGGIGRSLTARLVEHGDRVLLAARDEPRLRSLAQETGQEWLPTDATDPEQVERAVAAAVDSFGALHGAVNLAGSILLKPAHLTSVDEFRQALETNLVTAFNVVRATAKELRREGGSIVLVSSAAAGIGLANHEAVAAAKGGVEGLVLAAAATYASAGVRVNAVAPGLVDTPLTERIMKSDSGRRASLALHPLGRLGKPEDVAAAIDWLLDARSDWVTGQVIGVDGGLGSLKVASRGG